MPDLAGAGGLLGFGVFVHTCQLSYGGVIRCHSYSWALT